MLDLCVHTTIRTSTYQQVEPFNFYNSKKVCIPRALKTSLLIIAYLFFSFAGKENETRKSFFSKPAQPRAHPAKSSEKKSHRWVRNEWPKNSFLPEKDRFFSKNSLNKTWANCENLGNFIWRMLDFKQHFFYKTHF